MGLAVLALLGASLWGVGDFFGGLAARRTHVLTVLVVSQAAGLVGAAAWVLVGGDGRPALGELWPAVGAGAAGAVGLGALYRGMAVGAMGIVAPISAASPVVPLVVDLGRGIVPSALQWLGIVVVLGGITLLARERASLGAPGGLAAGVALALVAALGFGLFVVGIDAAADESVAWTVLVTRSTSTLLALAAVVAVTAPLRPPAPLLPMILAVGVFDTAANVLVAFATTRGPAGIVLLAREPGGDRGSSRLATGVALALLAALSFGLFVVGLDAAADASVPWAVAAARAASTLLALVLALLAGAALRPPARLLPTIVAVGVFDTLANVLVAFAVTRGSAGVVAVLSALYPVTTILLARVVLGEQLDRERRVGAALALGGAAAVAVG